MRAAVPFLGQHRAHPEVPPDLQYVNKILLRAVL
jgi:hypothetical protein